jgi:hydrogenase maturation protease
MECASLDHGGPTLIIGMGNPLRRDDGIGPHITAIIERWGLPGVMTRAVIGLTPELAADVGEARRVIFVDARLAVDDSERCEVKSLIAGSHPATLGHALDTGALLALAGYAYNRWPPALCVTVPAFDLSLGQEFSPTARREIGAALRVIAVALAQPHFQGETNHVPGSPGTRRGAFGRAYR